MKADPHITVGQLQLAYEDFMVESKTRDLTLLFKDTTSLRFKMAPSAKALVSVAPLLRRLVVIAPNGVLPRSKTAAAIAACHHALPCNFTAEEVGLWSQRLGELTRVLFSHLRVLLDPEYKILAYKKAGPYFTF